MQQDGTNPGPSGEDLLGEVSPLSEIEVRVQERAKDVALDLSTTEGIAGLRALVEDQILEWNEDFKRGLRPFALGDSKQLAERAYRNLAGYGPLTELLLDDDVWENIVTQSAQVATGKHRTWAEFSVHSGRRSGTSVAQNGQTRGASGADQRNAKSLVLAVAAEFPASTGLVRQLRCPR